MRAADFAALEGFNPLYHDGMEDVDLTLRAADGREGAFRVVANVAMTVLESSARRVEKEVATNQQIFMDEWRHKLLANDLEVVQASGFDIL